MDLTMAHIEDIPLNSSLKAHAIMEECGGDWIINVPGEDEIVMAKAESIAGRRLMRSFSPNIIGTYNRHVDRLQLMEDIISMNSVHAIDAEVPAKKYPVGNEMLSVYEMSSRTGATPRAAYCRWRSVQKRDGRVTMDALRGFRAYRRRA